MHGLAETDEAARPLWPVFEGEALPEAARGWAEAAGFSGKAGSVLPIADAVGGLAGALVGLGRRDRRTRARWPLAAAAGSLPPGAWRVATWPEGVDPATEALGWMLGAYRFGRYKTAEPPRARLLAPDGVDAGRLAALARAEALARDLINTPANDLTPAALADAARALADRTGAACTVTQGPALEEGFPLIAAVGRASACPPRLIDLTLGDGGPSLVIVGKGVCFDTGGLDLKPSAGMLLMKKDMGGAAAALALLAMLADTGAAAGRRIRVLIPAVENAVAGAAMRPGDVLRSRAGLTVEVNNTDAEGRLILADALTHGGEAAPDLMISLATLTGAARVALGPDLPPLYCDDGPTAEAIVAAGMAAGDPLWRMPFWDPYDALVDGAIADLDNAPAGGMAGSITAALFLRRFAGGAGRYVHADLYGWQPKAAPGRPQGGACQGARAILGALDTVLPR